jgi:hypothetical protein
VELKSAINDTRESLAALDSQVLAYTHHVSAFFAIFSGLPGSLSVAAWYFGGFVVAATFLLFLCLGGWPILALATASILKLLKITFNNLKELAQHVLFATGKLLSSIVSATQQCVDWQGALLLILGVAGIAFYSVAVETPAAYWQRFENGDLSLFEPANCIALALILLVFLCAISRPALAVRESGLLQSGEYECYDDKECVV